MFPNKSSEEIYLPFSLSEADFRSGLSFRILHLFSFPMRQAAFPAARKGPSDPSRGLNPAYKRVCSHYGPEDITRIGKLFESGGKGV